MDRAAYQQYFDIAFYMCVLVMAPFHLRGHLPSGLLYAHAQQGQVALRASLNPRHHRGGSTAISPRSRGLRKIRGPFVPALMVFAWLLYPKAAPSHFRSLVRGAWRQVHSRAMDSVYNISGAWIPGPPKACMHSDPQMYMSYVQDDPSIGTSRMCTSTTSDHGQRMVGFAVLGFRFFICSWLKLRTPLFVSNQNSGETVLIQNRVLNSFRILLESPSLLDIVSWNRDEIEGMNQKKSRAKQELWGWLAPSYRLVRVRARVCRAHKLRRILCHTAIWCDC